MRVIGAKGMGPVLLKALKLQSHLLQQASFSYRLAYPGFCSTFSEDQAVNFLFWIPVFFSPDRVVTVSQIISEVTYIYPGIRNIFSGGCQFDDRGSGYSCLLLQIGSAQDVQDLCMD